MTIEELLEHFDNGGSFGDDPEIVLSMRGFIQENRRLLYERAETGDGSVSPELHDIVRRSC